MNPVIEQPITNPWPGPIPYDIWNGSFFFGREDELAELRRMVLRERLTILSAESGAGKTSLLRAGLVYNLIRERERDLARGQVAQVPPVLILSDWGGGEKLEVHKLFEKALENALERLHTTSEKLVELTKSPLLSATQCEQLTRLSQAVARDHNVLVSQLKNNPAGATFFEHVVTLCDAFNGVIIIFDQFEEVLRRGLSVKNEALEVIKEVFRYESRAKLGISLRSEYHKDLHTLEAYVSGLYSRTFFLQPMAVDNVHQAITNSARAAGIKLEEEVVERIIKMLLEAQGKARKEEENITREMMENQLDLLTLQAILRELFEKARQMHPGILQIDQEVFSAYLQKSKVEEVVGEALERWIEGALANPSERFRDLVHNEVLELNEQEQRGIIRRIATRMAPYLSSGGYKVPADEKALLFRALRMDLGLLSRNPDTKRDDWQITKGIPILLDWQTLGLINDPQASKGIVTGLAMEKKWSVAQTAENLIGLFYETLFRLNSQNIIKSIWVDKGEVWELVHDRLGDPLSDWAEKQNNTWDDSAYAITPCRGTEIRVNSEYTTVKALKLVTWIGCVIEPREKLVFENYLFDTCDLKGTLFRNCTFRGGEFKDCWMDGVIFQDCIFEAGPKGEVVRFSGSYADGLTFFSTEAMMAKAVYSQMGNILFDSCNFNHLKLSRIQLTALIHFKNTAILFGQFEAIQRAPSFKGKKRPIIFDDKCSLSSCGWDGVSYSSIDLLNVAFQKGVGTYESLSRRVL